MSRMSFSLTSMICSLVSSSSASGTVVGLDLQAIAERDLVAHPERVHEEVDLAAVGVVEVQAALARVHRVEGDVRLVAGSRSSWSAAPAPFLVTAKSRSLYSR